MSVDDPRKELEEVIDLAESGKLPANALDWATGALATAEEILDTIDAMHDQGRDAPTDAQLNALESSYEAACRWLHRRPE